MVHYRILTVVYNSDPTLTALQISTHFPNYHVHRLAKQQPIPTVHTYEGRRELYPSASTQDTPEQITQQLFG